MVLVKVQSWVVILTLMSTPALATSNPSCQEIFSNNQPSAPFQGLGILSAGNQKRLASEVEEVGYISGPSEVRAEYRSIHLNALELSELVKSRDGIYPLIITEAGDVLIDHRLPSPENSSEDSFLGTHRGLQLRLERSGISAGVVFAGELRVVGGEVMSLNDQSGTYAIRPRDLSHLTSLLATNQARLEAASTWLIELGLMKSGTRMTNMLARNQSSVARQLRGEEASTWSVDGHAEAEMSARLEWMCLQDESCRRGLDTLAPLLHWLTLQGGEPYLADQMEAAIDHPDFFDSENQMLLGIWVVIAQEGVIDYFAARGLGLVADSGSLDAEQFRLLVSRSEELFREFLNYNPNVSQQAMVATNLPAGDLQDLDALIVDQASVELVTSLLRSVPSQPQAGDVFYQDRFGDWAVIDTVHDNGSLQLRLKGGATLALASFETLSPAIYLSRGLLERVGIVSLNGRNFDVRIFRDLIILMNTYASVQIEAGSLIPFSRSVSVVSQRLGVNYIILNSNAGEVRASERTLESMPMLPPIFMRTILDL